METITVALAGQPNVGKSSLINAISDAKLKVGNFSGVTVDKTEVVYKICDEVKCIDYEVHIIDLPGAYSLNDYTIEEKVTKDFLLNGEYDIIVNVVDSTHFQRNLLLTTQLLELGKKVIVTLNMNDEAQKEGIEIDSEYMSELLGIPCIKVSAVTKTGIEQLLDAVVNVRKEEPKPTKLVFSEPVEEEIAQIVWYLNKHRYGSKNSYRNGKKQP